MTGDYNGRRDARPETCGSIPWGEPFFHFQGSDRSVPLPTPPLHPPPPPQSHPLFEYVPGAYSLESKQSGPEAVHSATFNTEVQNKWICASTPHTSAVLFFVFGVTAPPPQWAMASSFTRILDHTQRHITVGRTPLDE